MTDAQRKGWLASIGGVAGLTSLLGLLVYWEQARPFADWVIFNLDAIWARPQVEAIVLAILTGVAVTIGLPWLLPARYSGEQTLTRLRLYAGGMSFAVAVALVPTRLGLVYAMLTGLAGTQVGMTALRLIRRILPNATVPESLKSNEGRYGE